MPIKVYLDHNIWNAVAPEGTPWRDSKWSKLLLPKIENGEIEVFISPASVMELVAFGSNPKQRNNIAVAMNTMVKGINFIPAFEYSIVEEILILINNTWNDTINLEHFNKIKEEVTRIYIGLIGQLAALPDYNVGLSGYNNIVKAKIINLIIHLKIIESPKLEMQKRLDTFNNLQIENDDCLESLKSMTIDELLVEKDKILDNINKSDGNTVQWIQKKKKILIEEYSKNDVMQSALYSFTYLEDRVKVLHGYKTIISDWLKKDECTNHHGLKVAPLPLGLEQSNKQNTIAFKEVGELYFELFNRFSKCSLLASGSTTVIIDELINAVQSGNPPTKGLMFDSNHFVAAIHCDILVTKDGRFTSTCKKLYSEMTRNGIKKSVVSSESEFTNAVKSHLNNN